MLQWILILILPEDNKGELGNLVVDFHESGCTFLNHMGGFQLEYVSISGVINHMTCYNSSALIGGKFI